MLKIYHHEKCSTCRNALAWLALRGIAHKPVPIRQTPPTADELRAALRASGKPLKSVVNTSGMDYRALGLKDRLPGMHEDEALALLASNGMLVKRPFAVNARQGIYLHGFREKEWAAAFPDGPR
ncbi:MAG: arsenate reductase family protein [Luteolibacter sp.]|jgi:arsenate reductase (glutaredoxin)